MDDARLTGGDALAFDALDVADAPDNDFDDDGPPAAAPRKKKYTILEIEGGDGTRRSGRGGRRRFVQEEGDDGIAIVSLDNGPFPEFRLPTDRRQYMHHQYTDDAPDPPPDEPPSQRRRGHSLEYAQQEDELLYLS
ncbi:uncharacterized protein LOC113238823 [Hyposmocoma kahamanoa]|uniref:uncharacterized protein LOC113238823 n=1 Tax=Hyposmocoma kahamanoa TaxID=1477025 RepID=UPI000E6D93B3|nr:uncharacterized protein LOC113238823 [Hyposmocoma kahamanoa]